MMQEDKHIAKLREERDGWADKAKANPTPYLLRMVKDSNKKLDKYLKKVNQSRTDRVVKAQTSIF